MTKTRTKNQTRNKIMTDTKTEVTKNDKPKRQRHIPHSLDEWQVWFKRKGGHFFFGLLRYLLILCIGYIILLPILEMLSATFMSPNEVGNPVSTWIPSEFSLEHIHVAFITLEYPRALAYTLATTAAQVVLQVLSAAITGYAFARARTKKLKALFFVVILTIVVPSSVLMLPQYIYFRNFDVLGIIKLVTGSTINLLGKPVTLYLLDFFGMGLKAGLYIYIFRQFFRGLPRELEEAAHVDGCGFVRTLFSIVMPNAMPGVITVSVLSFVWNWNDTYYANLFVGNTLNLMVKLNQIAGDMGNSMNMYRSKIPSEYVFNRSSVLYQNSVLTAATFLVILPLIILYIFVQKRFVESASSAGIVG